MSNDIKKGGLILVYWPEEEPTLYHLSKKPKAKHNSKGITLEEKVMRNSIRDLEAWTGVVKADKNSPHVRDILVQEICLRSLKGLYRKYMRNATRMFKASSERPLRTIIVDLFNMTTGSHPRSEDFWREEVLMEVLERFGACSLNAYEVQNLKDLVVQSPLWGSRTFCTSPSQRNYHSIAETLRFNHKLRCYAADIVAFHPE